MRRFDHETVNRGYSEYSEMVPTAEGDYVLYDDAANWKARAEKAEADRAELLEAARMALADCCDLIETDAGRALQAAIDAARKQP